MKRCGRQPGFTLMEMLVALAMMAVLAGSLYASLSIGFRARATAERALQPARATALALEMLRQDIAAALPPTGILAGAFVGEDGPSQGVDGDADTLTFFAVREQLSDTSAGASGIRQLTLAIRNNDDGNPALYRLITANLLAPTVPEPERQLLCRNVMAMNLRYFDGTQWLDSWDSTTVDNALPIAVEVHLVVAASSKPEADRYELTRSFMLPCGTWPSDQEGVTVGAAGQGGPQP